MEQEPKYSPKERQHLGSRRGGEVSRALRTGELEKTESGQYMASKEYIEKARKEMDESKRVEITEEKLEELRKAREETRTNLEALGGGGGEVQRKVFEEMAKKAREEYEDALNIVHPEMAMSEMPKVEEKNDEETVEAKEKERPQKSKWGWIKERVKGLATLGFWEVHQAEKFRSATKKVGKKLEAAQGEIIKTENLNYEEARKEVETMEKWIKAREKSLELLTGKKVEVTAGEYEQMSGAITLEKLEKNQKFIEETVKDAETILSERLVRYKNEFGKEVLTDNAKEKLLEDIKKELYKLQVEEIDQNYKSLTKLIRDNLDPKYWRRYIYGGVEFALDAAAIYLILPEIMGTKAAVETGTATKELVLDKTIWNTTAKFLAEQGIANPTNSQILEASKIVAEQNGIAVKAWNIAGQVIDTAMPKGMILDYSGILEKLVYIKGL